MAIRILSGDYGLLGNMCMWGEDSSLKIRVVTHPEASDTGRCLTSEQASN